MTGNEYAICIQGTNQIYPPITLTFDDGTSMTYFNSNSPFKPENKASDPILAIGTTTGLWHDVPAQFAQNSVFLCESRLKISRK